MREKLRASLKESLYFIAVIPPEALKERIRELKEEMLRRFQAGHALKSPAHITLQMPFRMPHAGESWTMEKLAAFAACRRKFDVELDGFGCFPPRVIFLRIADPGPLRQLHAGLTGVLASMEVFNPHRIAAHIHPHMTIATRDLTKEGFAKAWPEFAGRSFREVFSVDSLWILKHNGKFWEEYREFRFEDSL